MMSVLTVLKQNQRIRNYVFVIVSLGKYKHFDLRLCRDPELFVPLLGVLIDDDRKLIDLIEKQKVEELKKWAETLFVEDSRCPACHNTSKIQYRSRTHDWICRICGFTWEI
jgi:hypothetical protein